MDGALIVDKPAGFTSHDVVARVRNILRERSIGHLGTLDPIATGVLPLLIGRFTRLAQFFESREKEYEGEIRFGFETTTYDAAGEVAGPVSDRTPSMSDIEQALPAFRGRIRQQPPPFSAKKIGGKRAYQLARQQAPLELPSVEVEIYAFSPLALKGSLLRFRVRCSTGTYVRSLAKDLGMAVGVGAHLSQLRRTRVGEFDISRAITIEQLAAAATADRINDYLISGPALLPEMPGVIAPLEAAGKVMQGRAVNLPEYSKARLVRIFDADESLIAIGSRVAGSLFQPRVVFPRT